MNVYIHCAAALLRKISSKMLLHQVNLTLKHTEGSFNIYFFSLILYLLPHVLAVCIIYSLLKFFKLKFGQRYLLRCCLNRFLPTYILPKNIGNFQLSLSYNMCLYMYLYIQYVYIYTDYTDRTSVGKKKKKKHEKIIKK